MTCPNCGKEGFIESDGKTGAKTSCCGMPLSEVASHVYMAPKKETDQYRTLSKRFTYPIIKEGQLRQFESLREKMLNLADVLCIECPDNRERSLALTKMEEALYWAEMSIVRKI